MASPGAPWTRTRTAPLTSDAVLDRLQGLHPKVIDLSLDRVEALLHRLDEPHRQLPPVIHVAGTNGKGSTIAYMRAILEAAGHAVHVFTSPHLVRFAERIRVAGRIIDEDALTALLEECEAANRGDAITFFEITTAAAFLAFARTSADVLLLETGLGGRLDATNVVDRPAACVITPISLDHPQFLGDDLAGVAFEKAGILKSGVPCAVAAQAPAATAVIGDRAAAVAAPLLVEGEDWSVEAGDDGLVFRGADGQSRTLPAPGLIGAHQVGNAGLALAAIDLLDAVAVTDAARARGLQGADWPGRLHHVTSGNLVDRLPEDWQMWVDGGHNPAAGAALAAWAAGLDGGPLHLIVGMMTGKDATGFLAPLAPHAADLCAVSVPGEDGGLPAVEVAAAAATLGLDAAVAADVRGALDDLARDASGPARILVTGSLYLVGSVLRENGPA